MGSPWAGTCVSDPSRAWCVFMRLSLCAFVRIVARVLEMGRSPSPGRLSWWGSCVEAVRAVISPVRRPRPPYAVASVALNLRPLIRLIQQSLGHRDRGRSHRGSQRSSNHSILLVTGTHTQQGKRGGPDLPVVILIIFVATVRRQTITSSP